MRCCNCSGMSLTWKQQIDFVLSWSRLESLQETLEYLNVKRISWKGCLANGCQSERCSLDTHDEYGNIRTIFHIALMEMGKLKTLRIAFSEAKYPDGINFPTVFEEIKSSRRYFRGMNQSNLGKCFALILIHSTSSIWSVEMYRLSRERTEIGPMLCSLYFPWYRLTDNEKHTARVSFNVESPLLVLTSVRIEIRNSKENSQSFICEIEYVFLCIDIIYTHSYAFFF